MTWCWKHYLDGCIFWLVTPVRLVRRAYESEPFVDINQERA